MALSPGTAARGVNTGEVATWAMQMTSTPAQAQQLLDAVGPQNMPQFVGTLGLAGADLDSREWLQDPMYENSGVRRDALTDFMGLVNQIPPVDGAPHGGQAAFVVSVAQQASPYLLDSEDFRRTLGQGLGG